MSKVVLSSFLAVFALTFHAAMAKEKKPIATHAEIVALLQGRYDNLAQVEKAQATATPDNPAPPHLSVVIEPTRSPDYQLWRMHLEAGGDESPREAVWAMQISRELDGSTALVPYNLRSSAPADATTPAAFDVGHWFSLEACALRGEFTQTRIDASADGMPCVVVATGIGQRRTLLPVAIVRSGSSLQVHLIYQGTDVLFDARHVP